MLYRYYVITTTIVVETTSDNMFTLQLSIEKKDT